MKHYPFIAYVLLLAVLFSGCGDAPVPDHPSSAVPSASTTTGRETVGSTSLSTATTNTTTVSDVSTTASKPSVTTKTTTAKTTSYTTKQPTTTKTTTTRPLSYRLGYGLGNCRTLTGSPTLVVLFVEDTESAWDAALRQHFEEVQIAKAVTYLEEQAGKHGVDLDIQTEFYHGTLANGGRVYYPDAIAREVSERDYDLLETVVANMGEGVGAEFLAKKQRENGGEDVMFLFMINKDGHSYARCHIGASSQVVEYGVVYARNTDVPATDTLHQKTHNRASTIAHELLHLFGAEELYDPPGRNTLAIQRYEKDIMLWTESFISRNTITEFTAYCIGWTDTIPSVCYDKNWWQ